MIRFSVQDYMKVKKHEMACPHPILVQSLFDEGLMGESFHCFLCGKSFHNSIGFNNEIDPDSRYVVHANNVLDRKQYRKIRELVEKIVLDNLNHSNVDIIRLLREIDDNLDKGDRENNDFKRVKKK